ncbi:MAG: shikimate dehydrogenase [Anaerolineae bacterium]
MNQRIVPSENAVHLTGKTRITGVFGWPVAHSLSPIMHNAAFADLSLDWCYVPFAVSPDNLPQAVEAIRALGLQGINVTVPHKQAVISLLDQLTPEAQAIGAVNTILVTESGLLGHNTDAAGFSYSLKQASFEVYGKRVLVLGAGGAARAVVYALQCEGACITLLNRTREHAVELATSIGGDITVGTLDSEMLQNWADKAQLVVNTTSVGMWPLVDASPWTESVHFPRHTLLYDLVYNPRRTRLVNLALQAGARYVDGLWMLVHQGAAAFSLWTGKHPNTELMFRAADHALGGIDA